jgi:N-acetyl-alpha-D-glucosaminyl L-malate synthase BshA
LSESLSIAIVCYPSLGGSGVVASDLAAGLAERGHRVHVVASAPPGRALPQSDGLSFHPVQVSAYPLFDHPPYELAVASAIVGLARTRRLDVVHVHYAVPHAASALLARQMLGSDAPRVATTLHGTDVTRLGSDPRYREVVRFTVAASDGLTAPSEFLRREAAHLLGSSDAARIEVIPNFVDTNRFAPAASRDRARLASLFPHADGRAPVLFHVSNFRSVKRASDLIDVLARIRREVPARLVLVGDGPDREPTAARARELAVADSVRFLGDRPDFVEQLRDADAFLLPSESESFGVAALEAMSCGVPVFGYRVGGLPEVVGDHGGELVEPFDVDALARAVLGAVDDPARRHALGRAARERAVRHFDRAPAIARYEAFYRRLLAQASRRDSG